MIKRLIGILFAIATLAILTLTIAHREQYHSLVFSSTESTEEVSPIKEEAQPLVADSVVVAKPDSIATSLEE